MHILGRPLNCVAPLVAMVLGGVFEKFPRLKVVFFEVTAEFLVYWMHRMDDDYEVIKEAGMCPQLSMLPSEYVKRNCYISCEADEKWLPLALTEVGDTHVRNGDGLSAFRFDVSQNRKRHPRAAGFVAAAEEIDSRR